MWVRWLSAFVFTQLVEVPIYVAFMRGDDRPLPRRAALAFVASAFTHPVVWFVLTHLRLPYGSYAFVAELFAWLAEAVYMFALGVKRPLLASFVANATSAGVGHISRETFGWP